MEIRDGLCILGFTGEGDHIDYRLIRLPRMVQSFNRSDGSQGYLFTHPRLTDLLTELHLNAQSVFYTQKTGKPWSMDQEQCQVLYEDLMPPEKADRLLFPLLSPFYEEIASLLHPAFDPAQLVPRERHLFFFGTPTKNQDGLLLGDSGIQKLLNYSVETKDVEEIPVRSAEDAGYYVPGNPGEQCKDCLHLSANRCILLQIEVEKEGYCSGWVANLTTRNICLDILSSFARMMENQDAIAWGQLMTIQELSEVISLQSRINEYHQRKAEKEQKEKEAASKYKRKGEGAAHAPRNSEMGLSPEQEDDVMDFLMG